nr:hypothetical protein C4D60_Mb03t08650 [Ipomoea batatas]
MHSLVKGSAHKHEGIAAEKIGYGGGIAGFEEAAFVLEDEPVQLRVGREHGRLAEDVGGENGAVFPDPIVDEGLGILGLHEGIARRDWLWRRDSGFEEAAFRSGGRTGSSSGSAENTVEARRKMWGGETAPYLPGPDRSTKGSGFSVLLYAERAARLAQYSTLENAMHFSPPNIFPLKNPLNEKD